MTKEIERDLRVEDQADHRRVLATSRDRTGGLSRIIRSLGAAAIAGLVISSCGSGGASQGSASGEVLIKATEWKFDASKTQLTAGKVMTVTLQNQGKLEHDLKIAVPTADGKELLLDTQPGRTAALKFTPSQPGTYEFFCSLPGHKESGMKGQFVVVAP